ncbi:MAG: hypothetical protein EAZ07_05505 [Cytophagales bacterium]|nr:MAG: hypothetical protein EAZ07_05505 [Cytophagales bacterium]
MIYKVAFWVIIFFLGYNVYLIEFPLKNGDYYMLQEKAEDFVFDNRHYDTILVGSSLVRHFRNIPIFQGKQFYNLFLNGSSAASGIELIIKSGKIPKVLFVETHHLTKGLNDTLIKNVFQGYSIKQFLPALQSKHKFLNIIIKKIKPQIKKLDSRGVFFREIFYHHIEQLRHEYSSISDSLKYIQHLNKVDMQLQYLTAKGCTIYLFEVPIEKELALSKRAKFLRFKNHQILNNKNYQWIPYDYHNFYKTTDGIHLLQNESYIYEKYIEWCFQRARKKDLINKRRATLKPLGSDS